MKLLNRLWPLVCVVIAGCGGGGSDYAPVRPSGVITGAAIDGPLSHATVSIYTFGGGVKGEAIAETETDENGAFTLEFRIENQPLLVEVTGGQYTEEATSTLITVPANLRMRAYVNYVSGTTQSVMVTPLTTIAAGLTEYLVGRGKGAAAAVTEANRAIGLSTGVGDIVRSSPRRLSATPDVPLDGVDDATRYGFLLAAVSSYTAALAADSENGLKHADVPSIALVNLMYDDVRADGVLDGKGAVDGTSGPAQLEFAGVALDGDTYRVGLAQHMLVVANSALNKTGLAPAAILPSAQLLAESSSPIFPGAGPGIPGDPPPPLDGDPPVITTDLPTGVYFRELLPFKATVTDASGLQTVAFDVDGQSLGNAVDLSQPAIDIDTRRFADGEHYIGVRAIDTVGNIAYQRFLAYFDNAPPVVQVTSAALTDKTNFTLTGNVVNDGGAAIESITVKGKTAVFATDGTWQLPVTLVVGHNTVSMLVKDAIGNTQTVQTTVDVDGVAPEFSNFQYSPQARLVNPDAGRTCSIARLDSALNSDSARPIYFDRNKMDLAGLGLTRYGPAHLQVSNIPYIQFFVNDPSVGGVFTPVDQLSVTLNYSGRGTSSKALSINDDPQTGTANQYFLVPFTSDFFSPNWVLAPETQVHTVTLTVKDKAGRTASQAFKFRAVFGTGDCVLAP